MYLCQISNSSDYLVVAVCRNKSLKCYSKNPRIIKNEITNRKAKLLNFPKTHESQYSLN